MSASPALQKFFVDALGGALDVGLATPDDVLKHVTPDVLATSLPRPLWAKLLAACLAAPRCDARLVVETIGVPALAEHMPGSVIWNVIADVAARALGKGLIAAPPPSDKVADKPVDKAADKPADKAAEKPAEKRAEKPADKAAIPTMVPTTPKSGPLATPTPTPVPAATSKPTPAPAPASGMATRAPTAPPARLGTNPGVSTTPPIATKDPTTTSTTAAPIAGGTGTATVAPPLSAVVDIDFDDDDEPAPLEAPPHSPHRAPTVPGPQAFASRGAPANGGRTSSGAGASSRRPQASAPRAGSRTTPPSPRRAANSEFDIDTDVHAGKDPASGTVGGAVDVPVDDDQLIDWSSSEETVTSGGDVDRKR